MRGSDACNEALFSTVRLEDFVPAKYPLQQGVLYGARAVIARSQQSGWNERLLIRRSYSVVLAVLANKLARTFWAVLVKGKAFDQFRWNPVDLAAA